MAYKFTCLFIEEWIQTFFSFNLVVFRNYMCDLLKKSQVFTDFRKRSLVQ